MVLIVNGPADKAGIHSVDPEAHGRFEGISGVVEPHSA